jgi:molybdopterin converting factor small subunit
MSVRVLLFGLLTDIAGSGPHEFSLPERSNVQELLEVLFQKWPALRDYDASLLVAVNLTYARREEVIPPDAEVAVMPPVQGG